MAEPYEALIGPLLRQKGLTLAVAESCTGGLVGHRLTNIPGSSEYFMGGVIAYAYEAKEDLLKVRHDTLYQFGAVSEQTAVEMARGACRAFNASLGLSVTGIAGPGGGMPSKPVGTVWIGLSTPSGDWAFHFLWNGDREQNKADSAEAALKIVYDYLCGRIP